MSSYSISLDKNYERKIELLRNKTKRYKGMTNLDVINTLLRDLLDAAEPNVEKEKP